MNDIVKQLKEQATEDILGVPILNAQLFAKLIVQESLVDFYRRHLDTTSNEDITVQVERYVQERFGVE